MRRGVGHRHGSDPVLPWGRPAALGSSDSILSLGTSHAMGVDLKSKKQNRRNKVLIFPPPAVSTLLPLALHHCTPVARASLLPTIHTASRSLDPHPQMPTRSLPCSSAHRARSEPPPQRPQRRPVLHGDAAALALRAPSALCYVRPGPELASPPTGSDCPALADALDHERPTPPRRRQLRGSRTLPPSFLSPDPLTCRPTLSRCANGS